ncbi:MAG: dual specificity protein phosphatase family protein [Dongiaceae bacterium]
MFGLAGDRRRLVIAAQYALGAVALGLGALGIGGYGLGLLWPAMSLALVAGNYVIFGPDGFRKRPDGRIELPAMVLFAPYMMGAWINSRIWTRAEPRQVSVRQGIMLGRIPSRREATQFATIIDLCAEFPATSRQVNWRSFPMLDLVPPDASRLRAAVAAIEEARANGTVLVCCALGYSRSACALACWLLSGGHAANVSDAVEQIRRVRPRIVLSDDDMVAIANAVSREVG